MRLNEYINSKRGKDVSKEFALDFIKKNCSSAMEAVNYIYRGVNDYGDYVYIDPTKFTRVSANTDNYYTLIIDNSNVWSKYPKRSKSLVCSTDINTASQFGDEKVYRVFPIDNTKIGVCPAGDIWSSKHYKDYDFEGIKYYINVLYKNILGEDGDSDKNYHTMVKAFNEIDKNKNNVNLIELEKKHFLCAEFYYDYIKSKKTFLGFIEFILDPVKCGFKLYNISDTLPLHREVWMSSPCILINSEIEIGEILMSSPGILTLK